MKILRHLCVAAIASSCLVFQGYCETKSRTEDAQTIAKKILKRVEDFQKREKFEYENIDYSNISTKIKKRSSVNRPIIEIKADRYYSVELTQGDLDLIRFFSKKKFNEIYTSSDSKLYETPTKPKWSKEEAVRVASSFVEAVLGSFPENVGKPEANYVHEIRQTPKYKEGSWKVRWPRVDSHGYKFNLESLIVDMWEDYGPFSLVVKMPSKYKEIESEPLALSDVMEAAKKHSQEIVNWKPIRRMFKDGNLDLTHSPLHYLEIVRPNHLPDQPSLPPKLDDKARLAWVIWFEWVPNDKSINRESGVSVWIDAHTKEFLGGDAF